MPKSNSYLIKKDEELLNEELVDIEDEKFNKVMFLYDSALKEIKTKIDILQNEMRILHNYEPIEYITTRMKEPSHILDKLERKNLPKTYNSMFEQINDIAGIRIVCNFKSDVYKIAEIIEKFDDIKVLTKKDFMKNPKKSGYMSYHMIIEVPVTFSTGTMFVKVEVQIRTIGMDFWASLEHKLKYKNAEISNKDSNKLIKYAKIINNIDDNMLNISNNIEFSNKINKEPKIIDAADINDIFKEFKKGKFEL